MDFEKVVKVFTIKEPYYGIILSSMNRKPNDKIPTIGVRRSGGVFQMDYNPNFIKDIPLDGMIELLKHECLHICLNHMTLDNDMGIDKSHRYFYNMAIDMEANSYINQDISKKMIPGGAYADDFGWDNSLGAREYYKRILTLYEQKQQEKESQQQQQNQGDSTGSGEQQSDSQNDQNGQNQTEEYFPGEKPFDDHSNWPSTNPDEIPGEDTIDVNLLKTEIEDLVMRAAEEVAVKDPGKIPAHIKILIDKIDKKKPKPVCDWKKYFRLNLGNAFTDLHKKSKKRPSRRFPDAAGNRHQRTSHVLVAIDTSGSINMKEYKQFMEQLMTLKDKASFRVLECNTHITKEYEFKGVVEDVRGGGGTNFSEPINYFLENRRKYDRLVYFTDGKATIPKNTPKETLWVISSDGDHNKKKYMVNGADVVFIKEN